MYTTTIDQLDTRAWPLASLGSRKQEFVANVAPLLDACNRSGISIAFGGHFNSGKSTLLAALIGRDILPIGDIPETGVACRLRAGGSDQVCRVARSGEAEGIPFDRNTIAGAIAAYTHLGERRTLQDMPESLEIEIADAPIPRGATWIDSPGINDTSEMSDRAFQIAADADLLVWVLNSRQCLSDPEIQFLRQFVAQRGTEALALVLNVFLEEDSIAAWERFSARELPALICRVRDHAEEFGATGDELDIHVVSARAMRSAASADFGGGELTKWLSGFTDTSIDVIRGNRRLRAEIACAAHMRSLEPAIERAQAEATRSRIEGETHKATIRSREAFLKAAKPIIADGLSGFARKAEAAAEVLCEALVSGSLDKGKTYQQSLNQALRDIALGDDINDRLAVEYGKYSLGFVSQSARDALSNAVAPREVKVTVFDTESANAAIGGGAVVAGLAAAFFTGGLSLLAVGAGALAGAGIAQSEKNSKDLALTRNSIREAIADEVSRVQTLERSALSIIQSSWLGAPPSPPPTSDPTLLHCLEALYNEYVALPNRIQNVAPMNLDLVRSPPE